MKLCFDTDGTKTDFNQFIDKHAIGYFKKKYGLEVINPKALEIEEIFDIENVLINKGYSIEEAREMQKQMLDKFWISHRFILFSLLGRFRKDVAKTIKTFQKDGFEIEFDTSRAKTCNNDIVGKIARTFTIMQYKINGISIPRKNVNFYKDDGSKIKGLKNKSEKEDIILFDDKPEIINEVDKFAKVICVNANNNEDVEFSENVERIDGYQDEEAIKAVENLIGKNKYKYIKRKHQAAKYHNFLINNFASTVYKLFNPIVLNSENLIETDEPTIYAPNHRSTLDPIILTAIIKEQIHWAALKRFFDGQDSIFNNSKNKYLCKITAEFFKKLDYFPIERQMDNPDANNIVSVRAMNGFLSVNGKIGIFAEGTTNKDPDKKDFGEFDSSFLILAKHNKAWVQPITTVWIKDSDVPNKLIINVGKAFKVEKMKIDEALMKFLEIQKVNLLEIKDVQKNIIEELENQPKKKLKL